MSSSLLQVAAGLALAGGALLLVTGCSGGGDTEADCQQQVRFDEVVYTGWSTTTRDAQPLGGAERDSLIEELSQSTP